MMLDDVYGSDEDEVPLEQESEGWGGEAPGLEWEETEVRALVRELSAPGRTADWIFN